MSEQRIGFVGLGVMGQSMATHLIGGVGELFVFDVRPYLTSAALRVGYHATNLAFSYLPVAYALAAWKGATP